MFRLPLPRPIRTVVLSLLVFTVGIGLLSGVAIAPETVMGSYHLERTLGNFARFDHRISLSTWYSSSIFLIAAILLFLMATMTSSVFQRNDASPPKMAKRQTRWLQFSLLCLMLSADKSTGLHHAIVHDVLYRIPFPLLLKKIVLGGMALALLILLLKAIAPLWQELVPIAQRLFLGAAACFCTELGLDVLTHSVFALPQFRSGTALIAISEQAAGHMGGLFLIWSLLVQLQTTQPGTMFQCRSNRYDD